MRVKDRAKTQILGATWPVATGILSRRKGAEKPGYSRMFVHIICLVSYACLSFSQAEPNIEKKKFYYLLKFDPDIPTSLRGIIVGKLETLLTK